MRNAAGLGAERGKTTGALCVKVRSHGAPCELLGAHRQTAALGGAHGHGPGAGRERGGGTWSQGPAQGGKPEMAGSAARAAAHAVAGWMLPGRLAAARGGRWAARPFPIVGGPQ